MEKNFIPTLKGFVKRDPLGDLIFVWCPYCETFHQHGLEDGRPTMKNHRMAHCFNRPGYSESPFRQTGYYIKPFSKSDLAKYGKASRQ